jgi:hypothetical protein
MTVPVTADHIYIPLGPSAPTPVAATLSPPASGLSDGAAPVEISDRPTTPVPIVIRAVTPERNATPSRPLLVPVGEPMRPLTSTRTAKGSQAAIVYPRIRPRAWLFWLILLVGSRPASRS